MLHHQVSIELRHVIKHARISNAWGIPHGCIMYAYLAGSLRSLVSNVWLDDEDGGRGCWSESYLRNDLAALMGPINVVSSLHVALSRDSYVREAGIV